MNITFNSRQHYCPIISRLIMINNMVTFSTIFSTISTIFSTIFSTFTLVSFTFTLVSFTLPFNIT